VPFLDLITRASQVGAQRAQVRRRAIVVIVISAGCPSLRVNGPRECAVGRRITLSLIRPTVPASVLQRYDRESARASSAREFVGRDAAAMIPYGLVFASLPRGRAPFFG
jgi:hypothetical protein